MHCKAQTSPSNLFCFSHCYKSTSATTMLFLHQTPTKQRKHTFSCNFPSALRKLNRDAGNAHSTEYDDKSCQERSYVWMFKTFLVMNSHESLEEFNKRGKFNRVLLNVSKCIYVNLARAMPAVGVSAHQMGHEVELVNNVKVCQGLGPRI